MSRLGRKRPLGGFAADVAGFRFQQRAVLPWTLQDERFSIFVAILVEEYPAGGDQGP